MSWQDQAKCRDHADPDMFFRPEDQDAATAYWQGCPVMDACREAFPEEQRHGTWGGVFYGRVVPPRWRLSVAEKVEMIEERLGEAASPDAIAAELGMQTRSVARTLYRHGRRDLGSLFDTAGRRAA